MVDNLASHISISVFALCKENNVEFVCLPPNATHLIQPLDVGIYAPMKAHWKKMLREYKELNPGVNMIAKTAFPSYLKELVKRCKAGNLMEATFEKCGIFPINVEKTLERLPSSESNEDIASNLDKSLIQILAERRYTPSRGRGCDRGRSHGDRVQPGRSYCDDNVNESSEESDSDSGSSFMATRMLVSVQILRLTRQHFA